MIAAIVGGGAVLLAYPGGPLAAYDDATHQAECQQTIDRCSNSNTVLEQRLTEVTLRLTMKDELLDQWINRQLTWKQLCEGTAALTPMPEATIQNLSAAYGSHLTVLELASINAVNQLESRLHQQDGAYTVRKRMEHDCLATFGRIHQRGGVSCAPLNKQ